MATNPVSQFRPASPRELSFEGAREVRPAAPDAFPDGPFARSSLLSAAEWQTLRDIAGSLHNVDADVDLVTTGSTSTHMHILAEGWAYRARLTRMGGQSVSAIFLPGDIVNLNALFARESEDLVHTVTPSSIVSLPLARLRELQKKMPGLASAFLWLAMADNTRMSEWIKRLARQSAQQRLAHLFCELAVRLGVTEEDGRTRITLPLSQIQLSDITGITHIHTSRVLSALREQDLI